MNPRDLPLITLLVVIPLTGALLTRLAPRSARAITRLTATLELALALLAIALYDPGLPTPQLREHAPWIPAIGAAWHVALDPLGAVFVPLTAALTLLITLTERRPLHLALALVFQAALILIYTAQDAILFFAGWEAILIPILITGLDPHDSPHPAAHRITGRAVTALFIGGAALLTGLALLIAATGTSDLTAIARAPITLGTQRTALAFILIGLAVKAPLWPLHGWMPRLLAAGPLGIGLLVIGFKTGVWAILRLAPLCAEALTEAAPLLIALGVTSALWSALIALRQRDLRRLTAWITIAHAGLVIAAIATGTPTARLAALFDLATVTLTATALLLLAHEVEHRYGQGDLAATTGLAKTTPRLAAAITFFALAALGLPLTGGFIGELLLYTALAEWHPLALLAALLPLPLIATALARLLRDLLGGPARRPAQDLTLTGPRATPARLTLTLALATLLLGTAPAPILTHLGAPTLAAPTTARIP